MSTNAIIAVPNGDGWHGRHSHWDGGPVSMAPTLFALVRRDGLEAVQQTLVLDNAGWSSINQIQPSTVGARASAKASYGTPAFVKHQFQKGTYSDGRFENVPGYGVAYTEKNDVSVDEWDYESGNDYGGQWLYVLTAGGLLVGQTSKDTQFFGLFRWDQDEPDWAKVECGENYERCTHMAWAHFPEAEGSGLSTAKWLGNELLELRDATGFVDEIGNEWKLTGSGSIERLGHDRNGHVRYGKRWFADAVRVKDDFKLDMFTWSFKGDSPVPVPNPRFTFIYPPICTAALSGC